MAYADHLYVFFGGELVETSGQPSEIWQTGVRVTGVTDPAAYLAAIGGNNDDDLGTIHQWWRTTDNMCSSSAKLAFVSVAEVTATGQAPALTHNYSDDITGPNGPSIPNFVTACITLETATPKAHGGRGRIYPPLTMAFTGSSISTAVANQVATSGTSLMDALTGGGTLSAVPVVASKTYGTLLPIVACSADCILDTQRRRRNQLLEFRQTVAV